MTAKNKALPWDDRFEARLFSPFLTERMINHFTHQARPNQFKSHARSVLTVCNSHAIRGLKPHLILFSRWLDKPQTHTSNKSYLTRRRKENAMTEMDDLRRFHFVQARIKRALQRSWIFFMLVVVLVHVQAPKTTLPRSPFPCFEGSVALAQRKCSDSEFHYFPFHVLRKKN